MLLLNLFNLQNYSELLKVLLDLLKLYGRHVNLLLDDLLLEFVLFVVACVGFGGGRLRRLLLKATEVIIVKYDFVFDEF